MTSDGADRSLDVRTRRKLKDERCMRFRRAIERYEEHCRLQEAIAEFPDFPSLSAAPAAPARRRKNARPAHGFAGAVRG